MFIFYKKLCLFIFVHKKLSGLMPTLWYSMMLQGGALIRSTLEELWHGNISPETDSRTNTPEMKRLMEYMARHHDDLITTMTDEQKDIFERFDDCWSEYVSLAGKSIFVYVFRLGANIALDILSADYRS